MYGPALHTTTFEMSRGLTRLRVCESLQAFHIGGEFIARIRVHGPSIFFVIKTKIERFN